MRRPPRGKKRFSGQADGAGSTNLSNPFEEVDGRQMRRRYALYGALCLLLTGGIIALFVHGSSKNADSKGDSNSKAATVNMKLYEETSHAYLTTVEAQVNTYKHKKSGMEVLTVNPKDTAQDATFGLNFRILNENNQPRLRIIYRLIRTKMATASTK